MKSTNLRELEANPMLNPWFWIPVLSSTLFMLIIAITKSNREVFLYINSWSSFTGTWLWANISLFGDTLVAAVLILPIIHRRADLVYTLLIGGILALILSHLVKNGLDIARPPAVLSPDEFTLIGPGHRSRAFPSGHTTTVFTITALMLPVLKNNSWRSAILGFSILAGLSRITVGVHWPLDVMGGILTGYIAMYFGQLIYLRYKLKLHSVNPYIMVSIITISALFLIFFYDARYPEALVLKIIIGIFALTTSLLSLYKTTRTNSETIN